jgi:hypothetical protein
VIAEQVERLLEHPQLGARRRHVGPRERTERAQRLQERLVRQLRADQVDRPSEHDLEPGVAGSCRQLGREPGLADARLAGDEHRRAPVGPRRLEGALEPPELVFASDEHLARGSLHPGSIAPPASAWKALARIARRKDR